MQQYLTTWKGLHEQLEMISPDAPLIATILPYAKRVAEISERLLNGIEEGKLTKEQLNELNLLLESKEDPSLNLDVELAVSNDLLALATYLAK